MLKLAMAAVREAVTLAACFALAVVSYLCCMFAAAAVEIVAG